MAQLRDSKGRFLSNKVNTSKTVSNPSQSVSVVQASKTYVALVLDRSGSMCSIASPTVDFMNKMLTSFHENDLKYKQDTYVSLFTFANRVDNVFLNQPASRVGKLDRYNPTGMTALFDGVDEAINSLRKYDNGQNALLVYVITDGAENASRTTPQQLNQVMRDLQLTDRWTFVFHVPRGNTGTITRFGVPTDNVREWDQSIAGVQEVQAVTTTGLNNYYSARSTGSRSMRKFFADCSNVNTKDLKKLNDLSSQFEPHTVPKECEIKTFAESVTGKSYTPGTVYYQLSKPEKVAANKDFLIMEKGKRTVYGGNDARDLLNLPHNTDIRLVPGNLSNYDLFVSSLSYNRILVRGTKILVKKS